MLVMSENNLSTMLKIQPILIGFGFGGLIYILIRYFNYLNTQIPRIIYFAAYVLLGFLSIFWSSKLKKMSFIRSFIKMLPTYFTFLYLMSFPMFIFFFEENTFNAFIVFLCVAVNFPVFFNINPPFYNIIITVEFVFITIKTAQIYHNYEIMDMCILLIVLYILSFRRWGIEKQDFMHSRSEYEYKDKIEKELRLANLVQQSFFKHNETIYDDWAISYYNKPMAGVSGDFLDIYNTGSTLDGIGIFDVSGHGIASGLVTMLVKNIIFQEFNNGRLDKLKSILDRINIRYIKEKGNIENYLTGILSRTKGDSVEFINAGHSMPIFYSAKDDSAYYVEDDNTAFGAIGLPDIPTNFVSHTVQMSRGDELIFFTDGATEATNSQGEDFGKDRLLKSIFRNADRPLTTQVNCIVSDILTFIGNEPRKDDITIIILKKK